MAQTFLDGRVTLLKGDCLEILKMLPDNSIDSVVCDPPYHLTSIVKRFGATNAAPAKHGTDGAFVRASTGFMGRTWDAPDAPVIDPVFAGWFSGFVDGEGCFHVHKKTVNGCETYDCQFSLTLRDDDRQIVDEIQMQLGGIGSIAMRPAPKTGNGKPQVRYCISSQRDCQRLREIINAFPLRAKKLRDFEIWSHALDAWIAHEPGSSWEEVAYFRDKLMAVRQYGAAYHPSQIFFYRVFREVLRVLKPGGHLIAFSGTRTYHRMACAIEDAGFEIRDQIGWLYGSGFPKSHDVSKGIDKAAGAEREIVAPPPYTRGKASQSYSETRKVSHDYPPQPITAPATPEAAQWQGWGTALKPAWEPICLARKPLIGTVAQNVLEHGTGALNIDGCRVGDEERTYEPKGTSASAAMIRVPEHRAGKAGDEVTVQGRWPANIIHDGSEEVADCFPSSQSTARVGRRTGRKEANGWGMDEQDDVLMGHSDSGSAARFFYSAKADALDRVGSKHPTVKPLDLMQYLVRLVTPKGGTVLDPFAGTGTTGEAAWREGMNAILIEREEEYQADIARRMDLATNPTKRSAVAATKNNLDDPNSLPLFAGEVA